LYYWWLDFQGEQDTSVLVDDRLAELREVVREVGGAVERIDDRSMVAALCARTAFFGEDRMVWEGG
jgi:hypothetical protein